MKALFNLLLCFWKLWLIGAILEVVLGRFEPQFLRRSRQQASLQTSDTLVNKGVDGIDDVVNKRPRVDQLRAFYTRKSTYQGGVLQMLGQQRGHRLRRVHHDCN